MSGRAALALTLAASATMGVQAGTTIHRVRAGETLAAVAEERFADEALADLLALHNGLSAAEPLEKGLRLSLPQGRVVKGHGGQSLAAIAERALRDEALAPLLAALNGLPVDQPLFPGTWVVLPAMVEVPADRWTPDGVARRAYGAGGQTWPVRLANPASGETLRIPVVGFFRDPLDEDRQAAAEAARARLGRPLPGVRGGPASGAEPAGETRTAIAAVRDTPDLGAEEPARPPSEPAVPFSTRREPVRPPPAASPAARPPDPPRVEPSARARGTDDADPGVLSPRPSEARLPPTSTPDPHRHAGAAGADHHVPRPAVREPSPHPAVERARRAVERGEYHRAQVALQDLLRTEALPPAQQAAAWFLLGLSQLARGEEESAVESFRRARDLDPTLQVDAFFYSPKVRAAFNRAR